MLVFTFSYFCFFTVRPRKKNKLSSSRQKNSKSKSRKPASSSSQSSKQRAGPNSLADIDELVRRYADKCRAEPVEVLRIFDRLVVVLQVRQSSQTGVSKNRLELERCEEILKKLMKFRYSWPFRWATTHYLCVWRVISSQQRRSLNTI